MLQRLVRVYTCQNVKLLEISCLGSIELKFHMEHPLDANQISMCLDPHLKGEAGAKPSREISILTVPRRYFFCGSFVFIYVLCLSCFRVCSLLPCGHLLGNGWPLGSRLWCLIMFLSRSHVVIWVRGGTWLYRFLIFATFLTFIWSILWMRPREY